MKDKNLSSNKKKVVFFKIILYQIFICTVICFLMFILKLFFTNEYYCVNHSLKRAITGETAVSFFQKTFYNVKHFFSNAMKTNSNTKKEYEQSEKKEKVYVENKEESVEAEKTAKLYLETETSVHDDDDVMFINFKLPLKGKISSKFGVRPDPILKGKFTFHHGVDIKVIDGTPVLSIGDGIVKKIANSKKSGNYVSIKHGEMYESLYAHCSKILVSSGSVVKRGEKIALSGHSGKVTGPHLHLGIKKNGSWVNPTEILPNLS